VKIEGFKQGNSLSSGNKSSFTDKEKKYLDMIK
jgi:hypothetical protein